MLGLKGLSSLLKTFQARLQGLEQAPQKRRHDTQHNDTKHKDTQHNDTQHNDTHNNDSIKNDTSRTVVA